jgi:hypothetical protein
MSAINPGFRGLALTCTIKEDAVLNTEYRKCHHITGQDITDPQKSTKEEDLLAMMNLSR